MCLCSRCSRDAKTHLDKNMQTNTDLLIAIFNHRSKYYLENILNYSCELWSKNTTMRLMKTRFLNLFALNTRWMSISRKKRRVAKFLVCPWKRFEIDNHVWKFWDHSPNLRIHMIFFWSASVDDFFDVREEFRGQRWT